MDTPAEPQTPLRILYVEDNPSDAELARLSLARLAPQFGLEMATSLAQAHARLAEGSYDVVLSDLSLPDGSGLELLGHIRAQALPLAVVILTGSGDHGSAVGALKAGADDYLIKHADYLERLPQTLAGALARHRRESARKSRPLRVLYVEHNRFDIDLTRRHLAVHAPQIQLDVMTGAAEALAALPRRGDEKPPWDVLLLDYRLPGLDALETLKVLRDERGLDLPVVMVTGHGSEDVAAQALRLGVTDYLVKHPGYLYELPATLEKVQRQAELAREQTALRDSEARIRLLLESTAQSIYGVDLEGRCIFVNLACLRTLGYGDAAELMGRHMHGATHHSRESGAPYPEQACPVHQAIRDGREVHCDDEVFWHRDGSPIPVECWSYPMCQDGRVVGAVVSFFDISARRQAEEALRQAAAVFDSTREGVVVTDLAPSILAINPAFSEITGYTLAEVRGRNPSLLRSGRHDAAFYQAMWASVAETGAWQGEVWNRRKNGDIYPQLLTISTVRDGQGAACKYVGVLTDISQLKRSEERLQHLAHYDPLTGLPNRLLVRSRLQHALEAAERHGHRVGVLFLDLDRFKNINDSLGHPVGDDLLAAIAQRLRERLRDEDTLARLGGDEFLVVLEALQRPEDAAGVAQTLLQLLEQPFQLAGGHEVYVGASIGISLHPDDSASVTELIQHADVAMYQAKEQGRNTYRFYTKALTLAADERFALESKLRRALGHGEFVVHYQPQIHIENGAIVGCEALVRWLDPEAGLVPPARFIPLAEETGLIVPLGEWVLRTACAQARAWLDAGLAPVTMAVNLSGRQMQQRDLVQRVRAILADTGLPPGQLKLELTESMIMGQGEQAEVLLHALKAIGVKLAIDDFGTGYSSLAYLKRFPIDELKIDQSFVRDIPQDPNDMEIAATIIAMARNLNLKVMAEGVETAEQLNFLTRQRCHGYQGYLFSRPLPDVEVEPLLRANGSSG